MEVTDKVYAVVNDTSNVSHTSSDSKLNLDETSSEIPKNIDRSLRIKADLYLTFFISIVYGIQFADKTITSAATSLDLREDLGMLYGSAYSWVGSSFYLGYLVFEFPMSALLIRFPVANTIALLLICWGIIVACAAACQDKQSFLALRVLLGAFESAVQPAYVVLTAQWYKRKEHYARTLLWFAANGMGSILSGSIGYGLLVRQEKHGLAISGWRILYIIMGLLTIVFGVIFFFHVPNHPSRAWFLTSEEKVWQPVRVRENRDEYTDHRIKWYQVREAFIDPFSWLYCAVVLLGNIPNGGVTTFMNLILQGLHYNAKQSLLMGLPSGGCELVGLILTAAVSSYIFQNHRMFWSIGCGAVSVLTTCLIAWGPTTGSQLAGIYIWSWACPSSTVAMISCIESNSAGYTKKMTVNAMYLICYCVGNIIGPLTFKSSEQPFYHTGKVTMAITTAVQFGLEIVILLAYLWMNKRRDRQNKKLPPDSAHLSKDLTDWENPEFRYAL